jgi:hypothetical protein
MYTVCTYMFRVFLKELPHKFDAAPAPDSKNDAVLNLALTTILRLTVLCTMV